MLMQIFGFMGRSSFYDFIYKTLGIVTLESVLSLVDRRFVCSARYFVQQATTR